MSFRTFHYAAMIFNLHLGSISHPLQIQNLMGDRDVNRDYTFLSLLG